MGSAYGYTVYQVCRMHSTTIRSRAFQRLRALYWHIGWLFFNTLHFWRIFFRIWRLQTHRVPLRDFISKPMLSAQGHDAVRVL